MGTITFTATAASPAINQSAGVTIADADLVTIVEWATSQAGNFPDGNGGMTAATPAQALQWLATSMMQNALASVQAWQFANAQKAVVPPPLIVVTPT